MCYIYAAYLACAVQQLKNGSRSGPAEGSRQGLAQAQLAVLRRQQCEVAVTLDARTSTTLAYYEPYEVKAPRPLFGAAPAPVSAHASRWQYMMATQAAGALFDDREMGWESCVAATTATTIAAAGADAAAAGSASAAATTTAGDSGATTVGSISIAAATAVPAQTLGSAEAIDLCANAREVLEAVLHATITLLNAAKHVNGNTKSPAMPGLRTAAADAASMCFEVLTAEWLDTLRRRWRSALAEVYGASNSQTALEAWEVHRVAQSLREANAALLHGDDSAAAIQQRSRHGSSSSDAAGATAAAAAATSAAAVEGGDAQQQQQQQEQVAAAKTLAADALKRSQHKAALAQSVDTVLRKLRDPSTATTVASYYSGTLPKSSAALSIAQLPKYLTGNSYSALTSAAEADADVIAAAAHLLPSGDAADLVALLNAGAAASISVQKSALHALCLMLLRCSAAADRIAAALSQWSHVDLKALLLRILTGEDKEAVPQGLTILAALVGLPLTTTAAAASSSTATAAAEATAAALPIAAYPELAEGLLQALLSLVPLWVHWQPPPAPKASPTSAANRLPVISPHDVAVTLASHLQRLPQLVRALVACAARCSSDADSGLTGADTADTAASDAAAAAGDVQITQYSRLHTATLVSRSLELVRAVLAGGSSSSSSNTATSSGGFAALSDDEQHWVQEDQQLLNTNTTATATSTAAGSGSASADAAKAKDTATTATAAAAASTEVTVQQLPRSCTAYLEAEGEFIEQHWYHCHTCGLRGEKVIQWLQILNIYSYGFSTVVVA
jgi:trimeric autotransporter adhesin